MINREKIPQPNGKIEFHLPEMEKHFLDNGLKIVFIQNNKLPIVQLGMMIYAGSIHDPKGKNGLANLTSMMLDEGAGDLNALEFDEAVESLGSILNASTDEEKISVTMTTISENFEKSLSLFRDAILFPRFAEEDFDREKRKATTRVLQLEQEPSYLATSGFQKVAFSGTNYAFQSLGKIETLESVTVDSVRSYHKEYFSPANATLFAVGDFQKNDLIASFEKYFGTWKKEKIYEKKICEPEKTERKIYFIHRDDSPQTEIVMGHIVSGREIKNYFSRLTLNSILGGQFTSRINLNLREKRGITYGAHSSFSYNKNFGLFSVSTSVQGEHTKTAVDEIFKEIENIKKEISADELQFAKSSLIKRFPSQFETYSQLIGNMALVELFDLPANYFNIYPEKIKAVTLDDLYSIARNDIDENLLTTILVGNKEELSEQFNGELTELTL